MTTLPPGTKRQVRRRQVDRSAETRRRLLEATIDSLTTNGFAATSVESIVAGAGVTRGALNHHFAGKDDVIASALRETAERLAARLGEAFEAERGHADPYDRMVRALWVAIYGTPRFVTRLEVLFAARRRADVLDFTRSELLRGHVLVHGFWRDAFTGLGIPGQVSKGDVDFALMALRGLALEHFVRQDVAFVDRKLSRLAGSMKLMMRTHPTEN